MTTDLRFSGRRREDGTEVLAVTGALLAPTLIICGLADVTTVDQVSG